MIFVLDFISFFFLLLGVILTPLASLPFFPKILSDPALEPQFVFIFGTFLAFLFYCVRSILRPYTVNRKPYAILASFALFSLIIVLETIYTLHPGLSLATKQFSLANIDSLLPGLAWLALFFFFLIFLSHPFIQKFKKILFPLLLVLSFLSILSHLGYLKETPRLSPPASWKIAISQIGASPLLGSGPGQFVRAFDKFRPVELNNSPFWQFKFNNSSNEYLEILTTTGLLGFGAYLFFLFTILKTTSPLPSPARRGNTKGEVFLCFLIWALLLLAFFLPFSLPLRIIFILLLALALESGWWASTTSPFPLLLGEGVRKARSITLIIFITFIIVILAQYFRAEISFQQTQQALIKNQPQDAYQKNLEAIQFFPYKDSYHFTLSQISLAWANALAQNSHLSTDQKTLVGQLLGQAINQAKLAVTLAPNKSANLENLGIIYKNLIGVAADSDRWSLAAFNSASQLDPVNPVIRLEIGGVYYIEKNYESAERSFQNALFLKPDYANGLYNLALAQHAQGKISQAKDSLKQVINLTTPGSIDFQTSQKQLTLWNQEDATSSTQLSP